MHKLTTTLDAPCTHLSKSYETFYCECLYAITNL